MSREEYITRFVDYIVDLAGEEMREDAISTAEWFWQDAADRDNPDPEEDAATEMSYWEP